MGVLLCVTFLTLHHSILHHSILLSIFHHSIIVVQYSMGSIEQGFYWYKYQASSNGSVKGDLYALKVLFALQFIFQELHYKLYSMHESYCW